MHLFPTGGFMMTIHRILLTITLFYSLSPAIGQSPESVENLLQNGNFEDGNNGFESDLEYTTLLVEPGNYSITTNSYMLNSYFRDPVGGDHTSGEGYYLVADFNEGGGNIVWKTTVEVVPYTIYTFTVYFCNVNTQDLYNTIDPAKDLTEGDLFNSCAIRLMINGKEAGSTFYDKVNQYSWIPAITVWESQEYEGEIEIAIKSENKISQGNDLALDDISFVKTGESPRPVKEKPVKRLVLDNLIFEMGKSELKQGYTSQLDSLVDLLIQNPERRVRLEGHTDNIGRPEYLKKLSLERVEIVKTYLMDRGVDAGRIRVYGFGGTKPIADNNDESLRALNRRVEILLY